MKKRFRIFAASAFLLLAAAGITAVLYLRSDAFQERARVFILRKIEETTKLHAEMSRFRFDIMDGRFSVGGFSLLSPEEASTRIRFTADEITGSVRLTRYWKPKIELAELNLYRPRIGFLMPRGKTGGVNLARIFSRVIQIAARKAVVHDGLLEVNHQRIPLDLSVEDLLCNISYDEEPPGYRVRISYRNSSLEWAGRNIGHDLDASVILTGDGLPIENFELRRGKSVFRGHGALRDWKKPALHIETTGVFDGADMALAHPFLGQMRSTVDLSAQIDWDGDGFRSTGRFTAPKAVFRHAVATDVSGSYEIKDGVLSVREMKGRSGSGTFQALGTLELRSSSKAPHQISVSVRHMTVQDAATALETRVFAFDNLFDARLNLAWRRGIEDLRLDGNVDLLGLGSSSSAPDAAMRGTANFRYDRGIWSLGEVNLASPNTVIEAAAPDGARSHIRVATFRPVEVLRLIQGFSRDLEGLMDRYPDLADLSGRYRFDGGLVMEYPENLSYDGLISIHGGRWRSLALDTFTAAALWKGKILELKSARATKGKQSVSGDMTLEIPRLGEPPSSLSFSGEAHRISLASLGEMGLDFERKVSGTLDGRGEVFFRDGLFEGTGEITVEKGSFDEEPFDRLRAGIEVKSGTVSIRGGEMTLGSAGVRIEGDVGMKTRELNLTARLDALPLKTIPVLADRGLDLDGLVTASGAIRGTMDHPRLSGTFSLDGLRYASWNLGRGIGTIGMENDTLTADARIESDLGSCRARASISTAQGYPGEASLEFSDWNLQKMVVDRPSFLTGMSTALRGKVEIDGAFSEPSALHWNGSLDGASLTIRDYEIHNDGILRFSAEGRKVRLEEARIVGEGSNFALSGEVPLGLDDPIDLRLSGRMNLGLLDHYFPKVAVAGYSDLNVRAAGSLHDPQVIGQATLDDARLNYGEFPFGLSSMTGNVTFSRNSVRIESVHASIASGSVQFTGLLEHRNARLSMINLQAAVQGARLPYPKDFRSTVDANLNLRGGIDTQVLTGEVRVLRSEYQREFNVLEQLAIRPSALPGPQISDPLLAGVRLNVTVRSQDGIYIENELANLQGGMSLTLRGTLAYPSVTGRVEASEGWIYWRGNRFEIIRAAADFIDRTRINPVFDVTAEADVRSYRLRLEVDGDLDHLRFNVTSDPPLSTVEIVSLLTTGKSDETGTLTSQQQAQLDTSRRQSEITSLSAASILSESLTGVLGKRVERMFGLETFRVDPFLAGAENDPTARVTISERLSKDFTLTFSRNLSTNEEQIVMVEYDIGKNLTIVATRDETGKFGVDFRFRKRFR